MARMGAGLAEAATAQHGRMFLWLPVWLAVGIAVYFALPSEPAAWVWRVCAVAAVLLGGLAWRIGWILPWARLILLPLAFALAGFGVAQYHSSRLPPLPDLPRRAVWFTGRVEAVDFLPEGGRRLVLGGVQTADGEEFARLIHLSMKPEDPVTPDVGDQIRARAVLRAPSTPAWPGGRDPQFEAYFNGLGGSGRSLSLIEDLGGGHHGVVIQWRRQIAAEVTGRLTGAIGGIAATLMAGATGAIPQEDRAAFAAAGLAHILAVAGLHLAAVMGVVFAVVRLGLVLVPGFALRLPCKQIAAVAGLLAGGLYMLLTGAHVPTERSFAMAALVVLAVVSGRRVISLRGLALAALVILLWAPEALLGVSFQMSFSAVLALIVGYRMLAPLMARMGERGGVGGYLLRHLFGLAATSFLAGTATLPFAAAGFGQIQIYYVLANLLAVPVTVLLVMPLVVLALILLPLHAAGPVLWLLGKPIMLLLWLAHAVAGLPEAVVLWPPTPGWGLALVGVGITLLGLLAGRVRLLGLVPLALGLAAPFLIHAPDLLVAGDARAMAWKDGAVVHLWQANSGANYETQAWRRVWPGAVWQGEADCGAGQCRLGAVELADQAEGADCSAAMILALVPREEICPQNQDHVRLDRFDLWRNGAYAGWWREGALRLVSDRDGQGSRPWVRQPGGGREGNRPLAPRE